MFFPSVFSVAFSAVYLAFFRHLFRHFFRVVFRLFLALILQKKIRTAKKNRRANAKFIFKQSSFFIQIPEFLKSNADFSAHQAFSKKTEHFLFENF